MQSIDDLILENSVMHFEHKKRFENQIYKMNRESFDKRRQLGLNEVKRVDITSENTFMGNFINGRFDRISKYFFDMRRITFREKM
ncbi:hypothetical protein [Thermoflavimicrobium daqui]|uniref:Uncharacterized protein n=1 Tax=Thermoflavimicrobium daqui TaxID=2137476 RepID=A0A364K2A0_9BACL|nr:hypothetical protein [Thermoflavimicrobium daqui]RAL22554.1 hypothetical protein DL897_14170 [Thermoflavimicrobium daqui]